MQDNNNINLPPDDYRAQYQNYNYVPDNLDLRVGFGRRLGAWLLDYLIINIISMIIYEITGLNELFEQMSNKMLAISTTMEPQYQTAFLNKFINENNLSFGFVLLIPLIYFFLEVLIGASLGKMILNIKILDENRKPARTMNLLIRYLIKFSYLVFGFLMIISLSDLLILIFCLDLIIVFIGYFLILGSKRQGLHDMLAKTAVYRKKDILEESN